MLKRHISVHLRLLSFLCILCASISLMPSVASASSAEPAPTLGPAEPDPFSVLDADVTASPAPDLSEAPAFDPPMLLASSGSISTPYVSVFSEIKTGTLTRNADGSLIGGETYFSSQPFYADITNVDDRSSPSFGSLNVNKLRLFYESYSYSGSCAYLRFHLSIESDIVNFYAQASDRYFLWFVSDDGYAVYCQLKYSARTKDYYCKLPADLLVSDGYFYVNVGGDFRQESIKCSIADRFFDLSVNDFFIPTDNIPDDLRDYQLHDWIYYSDVSECPPFPGSSPVVSPSPSPGGTGGGGGSVTGPPATSDPALGSINDSINNQMQQDKEQHEETKGLLGKIIDGITSIPGKIIELLTDALKALFIPSDDFLNTKLKSFQDDLDNMGFLAWPVSASIDFLEMLLNSSGSSGEITLPAAKFNMDGKTITIWEETTFNFADLKSGVPVLFDTLNILFGLLMLVLVCQRAYNMWGKYFGQEPADVFSAIDVGDITD